MNPYGKVRMVELTAPPLMGAYMKELFAENVLAKMMRVAVEGLQDNDPPENYPELVPQTGDSAGKYLLREADFWTCGFFPGILYSLLERSMKYPSVFPFENSTQEEPRIDKFTLKSQVYILCQRWSVPIHDMASRTDTHDLGFMIQPSLRLDWELFGNQQSFKSILKAADSLATRYNSQVGAIRSWDGMKQRGREIANPEDNFLVIIDSMCNLDLLFYAGHHGSNTKLIDMAITHARTVLSANLRLEGRQTSMKSPYRGQLYSSYHVVNFDPKSGKVKQKITAQGYSDSSTWARGQAWGILGYAQTYMWTKDRDFLDVACGMAEYFIYRLEEAPGCAETPIPPTELKRRGKRTKGRYVPLWDFDAPVDEADPLRDASAGVIAANGMLVMYQAFSALDDDQLARRYLCIAIAIVEDTIALSLAPERISFKKQAEKGQPYETQPAGSDRFDAILKNSTANNNEQAIRRSWNHGLVYADYYLVDFGNRLLRMGLV